MFIPTANRTLDVAMQYLRIDTKNMSQKWLVKVFKCFFGSPPSHLAILWLDLCQLDMMDEKDKNESGFKRFLIANFFVWTYPKNSEITAAIFGICECYCRGEPLWKWIMLIASLKDSKIIWPERFDSQQAENFIISVDGVDFFAQERYETPHPMYNIDTTYASHKYNKCAYKYEVAVSVFDSRVVWVNGPFKGGVHDLTMFRSGLKQKIAPGKKVIADKGYRTSKPDEKMLSIPNPEDSAELQNFKTRVRCRHESFNSRLKNFNSLNHQFRHGWEKHRYVFDMVCVIVQTQMENGHELFDA